MSIKYKTLQKVNPMDRLAPKKYYANAVSSGEKDLKQIGKDIADISSLSYGDILNVLSCLILQLPKYLADGQNVKLGELGNFRINISTDGVANSEDFTVENIRDAKIIFTPGKELRAVLETLKFERVS